MEGSLLIILNHFQVIHPVQHFDPALHHRSQDLIGSEFLDKCLGLFSFLLVLFCLFVVVLCHVSQSLLILVVVSFIVDQFLVFVKDSFLNHFVKELSIVTHYHYCVGTLLEVTFQPHHSIQVQMVGRFIQEQYVGFHKESPGNVESHLPTS